jgi:hypothetical protein
MRGTGRMSFEAGDFVTRQGPSGGGVLSPNGILGVEVENRPIAQVGPGAIVFQHALLEEGVRTASHRAYPVSCGHCSRNQLDPDKLGELSKGHRRDLRPGPGRLA